MRKLGRKILSALLAFALLVSLIPVGAAPAQAAGEGDTETVGVFTVTGGQSGTDYTYTALSEYETNGGEVLTITSDTPLTISTNNASETTSGCRIVIESGVTANITLAGVNITPADAGTNDGYSGIDLGKNATLNITLQSDSSNVINGGKSGTAGTPAPRIHVPEDSTLTIDGNGSLEVHGASDTTAAAVGIGGMGSSSGAGGACGNVIILEGTITVQAGTSTTGSDPVDIGGGATDNGKGGDCSTVIILTSVNNGGGLTIGGGAGTTVGGGKGSDGQGIRPGEGGTYTVYGDLELPCDITIPDGVTVVVPEGTSLTVPKDVTLTNNGTIRKDGGSFINDGTVTGQQPADDRYAINYADETITIAEGYALYDAETGGSTIIAVDAERTASITTCIPDYNSTAQTLYLQAPATGEGEQPDRRAITIPARPEAPNDLLLMDWTDVSVTYYVGEGVQCRLGNEEAWVTLEQNKTNHTFNNLTPQTTYTIYARKPATESQFASAEASDKVTTKSSAAEPPAMTYEVTANSITLSYSAPWQYQTSDDEWISVEGAKEFASLEAATEYNFTVRVAESETAEASKVGTVKVYTAHAAPVANEGYTINYATETLTVKDGYEVNTAEDFTGTAIQSGTSLSDYIGSTLYIRHKADANGAPASAVVALTIPARPAAPANISGGTEQISGVDTSMEYRAVGSTGWTRCTGTSISNLSDGDYEVRIAATDSAFASEAVQVHVSPYTGKYSYEISTSVGDNGTIFVDRYATEGERVTITVSPDDAYKLDDLSVTANGKDVELTDNGDGTFSFTMPSADVKISATFAEDPDWTEPEEPATDVSEIFIDVAPNAWYKDAVQYAYDNGLMRPA